MVRTILDFVVVDNLNNLQVGDHRTEQVVHKARCLVVVVEEVHIQESYYHYLVEGNFEVVGHRVHSVEDHNFEVAVDRKYHSLVKVPTHNQNQVVGVLGVVVAEVEEVLVLKMVQEDLVVENLC